MKRNIFSTLIMTSILFSSCGKKNNISPTNSNQDAGEEQITEPLKEDKILKSWLTLITNKEKNNIALATILSQYVKETNKAATLEFIDQNLNEVEIESIIKKIKKDMNQKELELLSMDSISITANNFEKTIFFALKNDLQNSIEKQLVLETVTVLRNKYLLEINKTYENSLHKNIKEITPKIQKEMVEKFPSEAQSVENDINSGKKESAIQKLKMLLTKLESVKIIKEEAGLNDTDMIAGSIIGLVAYQIYQDVKETRTIRNIKIIIEDINVFQKKVKATKIILSEIKSINKNSAQEFEKIKISSQDLKNNSKDLIKQIKNDLDKNPDSDLSISEKIKALNSTLFKKKSHLDQNKLGTYQQKTDYILSNINNINSSITNINQNFNNSIAAFEKISETLGLKLGKDAQKIIKGAKKISSLVSMATSITTGALSGNPIGAFNALSSALGGSSSDAAFSEISSKLTEIDRKLDEVISLQKQMIEIQLETMKMVRDLSLLVDELHQKEMTKLNELRDDVLVNIELTKALSNREIKFCETIISNQIYQRTAPERNTKFFNNSSDILLTDLTLKEFYGEFKNYKKFTQILKAQPEISFQKCQEAMTLVFGTPEIYENPTSTIYTSGEQNALQFYKNKYRPLADKVNELKFNGAIDFNSLHLPLRKIHDHYLKEKNRDTTYNTIKLGQYFDFDQLISSNSLIRHNNSLLILYPLLNFELSTLQSGIESMIENFFENLEAKSRSLVYLENSLYFVNNSIAQENLLSGALLLEYLSNNLTTLFSNKIECSSNRPNFVCAVLSNKLILTNLINYLAIKSGSYHPAFNSKNIAKLENALALNSNVFQNQITERDDKLFLKISYIDKSLGNSDNEIKREIELKSIKELNESNLLYSENMEKLIKLQAKLIEAINSKSPQFLNENDSKKYSSLILLKAI